jgi:acetolactate synthase I/II/III large subunit
VKLSDYVAWKLAELGLNQIFMVTGGGAMHLNHSIGTRSDLKCVFNHHEQACAMAADSYCRLSGKPAVVNVTTGPGGTNAITGVWGAWTDSIGMLVLSGQVKFSTTVQSLDFPLRQLGDQEIDIVRSIGPITKYAITVTEPSSIRYHIEKAAFLTMNGRPGPCWLDIPMDVQSAEIEPAKLLKFNPKEIQQPWRDLDLGSVTKKVLQQIRAADRPVVLVGSGVRLSGCAAIFLQVAEVLQIPIVTAWNAHDLVPNEHALYAGRPGTVGTRPGNFTVQNCDYLLILGSRLNIRQVSYEWTAFARGAYIAWVDIDEAELNKPTVKPDLPINSDLREFLPKLQESLVGWHQTRSHYEWLMWCRARLDRYPVPAEKTPNSAKINPYYFVNILTNALVDNDIVVAGNGTACVATFQAAMIKPGQRLVANSGCSAMGYDLPAAIGAALARPDVRIICLAGDGSIMMNLQELQVISHHKLPIRIFLLNNNGYASIAQTQKNYFNGVEVGNTPASGVSFPKFQSICEGFGIEYSQISKQDFLEREVLSVVSHNGPYLCEIMLDPDQPFSPKVSSRQLSDGSMVSSPLEDMAPFLPRDEFLENMIIPPYSE